jgi:preprotein translocase subunit YajC
MNLIPKAWAAAGGGALAPAPVPTSTAAANATIADAPSAAEAFGLNLLLIAILVGMFYVLLIIPQQKRFKKHRAMLDSMKKGDRVLTSAGFIGTVDKIEPGNDEVIVDLGGGLKVTALRSTIQSHVKEKKDEKKPPLKEAANKDEADDDKKSAKK